MDIAHASFRLLVNDTAVILDPLSIAGRLLIREGLDGDYACLFGGCILNCELHLVTCLIHQQFLRTALMSYALSIDGKYSVTYVNIQPGTGEWRSSFVVRGIALYDASDAITISFSIVVPVH